MNLPAIKGGTPVRDTKLFYGHQCIDENDVKAVSEVLVSDYLTCGPKVSELEEKLAAYCGCKYAVAVSNGTAALHCACIAAGLKPGDEVITTPLTFAASANCVLYVGATPVFADVNPETYNIDPESIKAHITDKTKAVIAVDFTGQCVENEKIRAICDEYNLIFIEDAAHAIGSSYKGKKVGSLANEEFHKKLVLAHTHGITHDEDLMEDAPHEGPWYYEQISLGYNYRLTDIQSALLISQLEKLELFKKKRQEIVKKYNDAFSQIPEIIVQKEIPESDTCRHLYIIRLNLDKLKCTRREFFDAMSAENIQCQVHYVPTYLFPYYRHLGYKEGLCPNAEEIYKGILSIPLYPTLSEKDTDDVIEAVKKIVDYYRFMPS